MMLSQQLSRKNKIVAVLILFLVAGFQIEGFVSPHRRTSSPFNIQDTVRSLSLKSSISTIQSLASSAPTEERTEDINEWEYICRNIFSEDKRPVILFDGVCNLCNGAVNFALDNDTIGCLRFASLQSEVGRALLLKSNKDPDDMSSLVLVTETDSYFKADAALRIISKLNGNRLLSTVGNIGPFFPKFFNNYVYDLVAKNRYKFGEYNSCRLDGEPFMDRFIPDPCNDE